jgi:Mg-chelatase subunit ChlD
MACSAGPEIGENSNPVVAVSLVGVAPAIDFQESGRVNITLVPTDAEGKAALSETLKAQTSDPGIQVETMEQHVIDESLPIIAAISMDASGSMQSNDPDYLRVAAAKAFIDALSPGDLVAVMDFGTYDEVPFLNGRLLIDFTDDHDAVKLAAEGVEAFGITPLYESTDEIIDYFDAAYSDADGNRGMLILGDVRPNNDSGTGTFERTCLKSQEAGIPLNTIGFGLRANSEAEQVLQDLASCNGGAYTNAALDIDLVDAFRRQAEAATRGSVSVTVNFSPIPQSGEIVTAQIGLRNGDQGDYVSVEFSFEAP